MGKSAVSPSQKTRNGKKYGILLRVSAVASSRYTCAEVGVIGEGDYGIREQ